MHRSPADPARRTPSHRSRGFTLIELMIAVAVVTILASLAYPSYRDHVQRSHRAAAQAFLMDVALRQQQRMLDVRAYAASLADLGVAAPDDVADYYTFDVDVRPGPPASYVVSATPAGSQAGDACSVLSLSSAGAKLPADCW